MGGWRSMMMWVKCRSGWSCEDSGSSSNCIGRMERWRRDGRGWGSTAL